MRPFALLKNQTGREFNINEEDVDSRVHQSCYLRVHLEIKIKLNRI